MSANLFELIQGSLGPHWPAKRAGTSGSPDRGESRGRSRLARAPRGPMQQGSTPTGATELFRSLTGPQVDTGLVGKLGGMLVTGDKSMLSLGNTLIGSLFGDRTGAMTSAISSMSGMKTSSVATLLAMAAPAVFSYLKGYLAQNKLDVGGLTSLLAGQREHVASGLDDRITRALGFTGSSAFLSSLASSFAGRAAGAADRVTGSGAERGNRGRAGRGSGVRSGHRRGRARPHGRARVPEPVVLGGAGGPGSPRLVLFNNWSAGPGVAMKSLDLPGGARIQVQAGGFLDSLNGFLSGTGTGDPRSFTIDNLQFETGSATLSRSSDTQLAQLAAVLKAYPKVTMSVRGHTDATGDPAANKKLSADRAAAVKQALVERGVPAAQIESEGHGSERPIASNDSEDGRARNRRVELVVVKS